ncbi:unnamed protein product [Pleuronectes platessa]|uniref:Uncharacterized protein n=1 Tax=Pleuronectes platessa TaxID=8262 RepID=A0A9N7VCZ5_PLEPL|nr:unnamed protein product [Pleuronectes platessa]
MESAGGHASLVPRPRPCGLGLQGCLQDRRVLLCIPALRRGYGLQRVCWGPVTRGDLADRILIDTFGIAAQQLGSVFRGVAGAGHRGGWRRWGEVEEKEKTRGMKRVIEKRGKCER